MNIESEIIEKEQKKIGYINLEIFSFGCGSEFTKHLNKLEKENITSLIIDLRDNPGGIENELKKISCLFLDSSDTLFIKKNRNKEKVIKVNGNGAKSYPIVILVNENTASCSEVLACALKENVNAKIIGTRTTGKGVGQTVVSGKDYMYKYTSDEWFTPNKNSINKTGIIPDIIIENKDKQLDKAINYIVTSY